MLYNIELNSQNLPTSLPCKGYGWQIQLCEEPLFYFAGVASIAMSSINNISSSLTLNEFLSRLGYATSNPGAITIVSLNTSHPVPIHTSDSQKYYLIIGGRRRLIPDIQTLRYLEHKYNFNENRDIITVPYSQITKYPDGGSFTSVVVSTRQAQQQLSNLFSATQQDYSAVMSASSSTSTIMSQASSLQSNYKNSYAQAKNDYNNAVSSYNKGKKELSNKAPYTAQTDFNQAKSYNTQAVTQANQARAYLSQLNALKSRYVSAKNNLISLKQKYQAIIGTIAKQLGLATSNEFVKANTSGLMQIQSTASMAKNKSISAINQINSSINQLAAIDITKISMSSITPIISSLNTQSSSINSAIAEAEKEATEQTTQANLLAKQKAQAQANLLAKQKAQAQANLLAKQKAQTQANLLAKQKAQAKLLAQAKTQAKLLAQAKTQASTSTTPSTSLIAAKSTISSTGISSAINSLDSSIKNALPESLKTYSKYVPYAIGALAFLLLTRKQ